jgi:uncharacterized protein YebE (UPF0316 family)
MMDILYFLGLQLINVVISTFKSVLTIRGTRLTAALISALSYSIGIVIVYLVSRNLELYVSVIITIVTNLIGVYTGLTILDKFRKEQLWRIQTSVPTQAVSAYKKDLREKQIKFISYETTWEKFKVVDIFSESREESKLIKEIIHKHHAKYTISSNSNFL